MPRTPAPLPAFERPLTGVDLVIFTVRDAHLQVLLTRRPAAPAEPFPHWWALPGGFIDVDQDTSLEACARRKLAEKTGLSSPYLEQLGSFGSRSRDPRGWSATHVYFALLPDDGREPQAGGYATDARWHPVRDHGVRDKLAFDHTEILAAALERLRGKVEYTSLPAFLLPEEFTLTELQQMYEVILDRPIERSAFRRRVRAADLVVEVPRQREGSNRPAQLYRLKDRQTAGVFSADLQPTR